MKATALALAKTHSVNLPARKEVEIAAASLRKAPIKEGGSGEIYIALR
jgi:hypothetical protein